MKGTLLVRNAGAGRSRDALVRFYLSYDDVLDSGDVPVGAAQRVRPLGPGEEAGLPVAIRIPGLLAGERLLAVVDPDRRLDDLDRPDNTAAIRLGP